MGCKIVSGKGETCLLLPECTLGFFSSLSLSLSVSEKSVYLKKILFIHPNLSWSWEETFTCLPGWPVSYQTNFSLGFVIFDVILGQFPAGSKLSEAGCLQRSWIKWGRLSPGRRCGCHAALPFPLFSCLFPAPSPARFGTVAQFS